MDRRTKRVAAGIAVVGVVVAIGGWLVARSNGPQQQAAADASVTGTVTRQTLTDSETRDGTVAYAEETTLRARGRGTLTWLAKSGSRVGRDQVICRIDQNPTVLMYGTVPAYRTMQDGSKGRDVRQLERNLRALGYKGFTVNGSYTADTADAVREWQDDLGVDQTGVVQWGAVDFQPEAIRMGAAAVEIGEPVQPGAPIAAISGVTRAVTVSLEDTDRDLAKEGEQVLVDLGSSTVSGEVNAVDATTTTDQGGDSTTTYDVTIELAARDADKIKGLPVDAAVDVDFDSDTAKNVLSVPVKALLALSEGGYGVELVGPSGQNTIVAVDPGMFAGGSVEIEGKGIAEGDTVVVAP